MASKENTKAKTEKETRKPSVPWSTQAQVDLSIAIVKYGGLKATKGKSFGTVKKWDEVKEGFNAKYSADDRTKEALQAEWSRLSSGLKKALESVSSETTLARRLARAILQMITDKGWDEVVEVPQAIRDFAHAADNAADDPAVVVHNPGGAVVNADNDDDNDNNNDNNNDNDDDDNDDDDEEEEESLFVSPAPPPTRAKRAAKARPAAGGKKRQAPAAGPAAEQQPGNENFKAQLKVFSAAKRAELEQEALNTLQALKEVREELDAERELA